MKKKWITVLAAGVMAVALLAGCKNKAEGEATPTPVSANRFTETPAPTNAPTDAPTNAPTNTVTPTIAPSKAPELASDSSEIKITLGQYKGLTINEVDSSLVAERLYEVLSEYASLVPVERAAKEGDTVNINYIGKKDGVAFEGGTDDSEAGFDLTLGSGQFIDGFEDGLIGAVAGEVRDLNLTFPENYDSAELAGQSVVFTVTVNAVLEEVVPEATDEFAKEYLGYDTLSEYIIDLYAVMNRDSFFEQITEAIMGSSTVEHYPEAEIKKEKQRIYDYYYNYALMYGSYFGLDAESALNYFIGFDSLASLEKYAEDSAYQIVKNNLVLVKIAELENLTISTEEYEARVQRYATAYGYETTEAFLAANDKDSVDKSIFSEYVMDYLITQSSIIKSDYDAIAIPE